MPASDFLIALFQLPLTLSAIPTVLSDKKPHILTSCMAAVCLSGIGTGLLIEEIYYGGVLTCVSSLLWLMVTIQTISDCATIAPDSTKSGN